MVSNLPRPVAVEIVGNRLGAIADEMSAALVHAAYSTFVKESADASTAILDAHGRLVAQASGTLVLHAASLRECLRTVLTEFPADSMGHGDAFVMSDPYRGGIHANDLAVFTPVRIGAELFFCGAVIHVADLGGVSAGGLPGEAREVFQEGLLLPPIQLQYEGTVSEPVRQLLALNSRVPDIVLGDVAALLSAVTIGAQRLSEAADRWGPGFAGIVDDVLTYTRARVHSALAELPLGEWKATFTVDDDGVTEDDHTVVITLRRPTPESFIVDMTGTGGQAVGPINAAYSQSISAAVIGLRCILDIDVPMNEGVFSSIETVLPIGSLVNPLPPHAVNARIVTVSAIVECLLAIGGQLRPEFAVAGSSILHVYMMTGGTRQKWLFQDQDYGGAGATARNDGANATGPYFMGGRGLTVSIEALEAAHPVLFTGQSLVMDSGGPGEYRGGTGVRRSLRVLEAAQVSVRADRVRRPPRGIAGGSDGVGGRWSVAGAVGERQLRGKQMLVPLADNDELILFTSGGGGVGDPLNRDPDAVVRDVRLGMVSVEGARRDYGVVLTGAELTVDRTATAYERSSRSQERTAEESGE